MSNQGHFLCCKTLPYWWRLPVGENRNTSLVQEDGKSEERCNFFWIKEMVENTLTANNMLSDACQFTPFTALFSVLYFQHIVRCHQLSSSNWQTFLRWFFCNNLHFCSQLLLFQPTVPPFWNLDLTLHDHEFRSSTFRIVSKKFSNFFTFTVHFPI